MTTSASGPSRRAIARIAWSAPVVIAVAAAPAGAASPAARVEITGAAGTIAEAGELFGAVSVHASGLRAGTVAAVVVTVTPPARTTWSDGSLGPRSVPLIPAAGDAGSSSGAAMFDGANRLRAATGALAGSVVVTAALSVPVASSTGLVLTIADNVPRLVASIEVGPTPVRVGAPAAVRLVITNQDTVPTTSPFAIEIQNAGSFELGFDPDATAVDLGAGPVAVANAGWSVQDFAYSSPDGLVLGPGGSTAIGWTFRSFVTETFDLTVDVFDGGGLPRWSRTGNVGAIATVTVSA